MAGKEATVYIIDQGVSMGDCHNGRAESDLDYGMQYVWDKMAATMATGLKGLSTGVIGLRTDETNNMLSSDDDSYENISVMRPLGPMEIDHLQDLRQNIKPSNTNDGDAISAIVVAIDRIVEFTTLKSGKQGKFTRKIVLLTDGQGPMDGEDMQSIADRINEFEIQLVVM
jgi:ATP-dependent DNA helicase 2 subunit 2